MRQHLAERRTIGVLLDWPDATGNYHRAILKGIRRLADERDVNLLVIAVGRLDTPHLWERGRGFLFDYLSSDLLDGLLVYSAAVSSFCGMERLEEHLMERVRVPIVSIGAEMRSAPSVLVDNASGFRDLMTHLIEGHGYRRIGYVGGPSQNVEAGERLATLLDTAAKHGVVIPQRNLYEGDFSIDSGAAAIEEFLDVRRLKLDAVVCANDDMAIGVWQELWSRRIIVPDHIAVTGFDDLEMSTLLDLPFTTVRQPFETQGYQSASLLMQLLDGRPSPPASVPRLPTSVVYRSSCGCELGDDLADGVALRPEAAGDFGSSDWFKTRMERMRHALTHFLANRPGDPLIRAWNAVLLNAIENGVRQRQTELVLNAFELECFSPSMPEQMRTPLARKLGKMRSMLVDFYIQTDLLTRITVDNAMAGSMVSIDAFEQATMTTSEFAESLGKLDEVLEGCGIRACYLARFDGDESDPAGTSSLLYAYLDGQRVNIAEHNRRYANDRIIHPAYRPNARYELIVEALYDGPDEIGIVCFGIGANGVDTYEVLRRRLSGVVRSVRTRDHLLDLNRQLQEEIEARARVEAELKQALETVQNLSLTDDLTGVYNRRGFLTLAEQQLRYCLREGEPCLVLYFDLNGLKAINDSCGHHEGDFAIQTAAGALSETFREVDVVSRLGGDEFAVFAGKADGSRVPLLRNRLHSVLDQINGEIGKSYRVRMSMGSYEYAPEGPHTLSEMLDLADADMYRDKRRHRGENRPGT